MLCFRSESEKSSEEHDIYSSRWIPLRVAKQVKTKKSTQEPYGNPGEEISKELQKLIINRLKGDEQPTNRCTKENSQ